MIDDLKAHIISYYEKYKAPKVNCLSMRIKTSKNNKERVLKFLMVLKFCVPAVIFLLALRTVTNISFFIVAFLELLFSFIVVNLIAKRNTVVASIIAVFPLLIIGIQSAVLLFSGRYVNTLMLTNLSSISALSGKALQYGGVVLCVVIILLLPVHHIDFRPFVKARFYIPILAVLLIIDIGICMIMNTYFSPTGSLASLVVDYNNMRKIDDIISDNANSDAYEEFYRTSVDDYINMPQDLNENPDIVIIFMEGCSQNIIDDPRDIMPNIAEFQEQGLTFTNYYNHTAATYRGLIGQLYSAHQLHNSDTNQLISVQEILGDYGYETEFINCEPENQEFSEYLNHMGFDDVSSPDTSDDLFVLDSEMYDSIYNSLSDAKESSKPRLIVAYTFGTHCACDSMEETFGDGDNRFLNRFYNTDYQFGAFFDRLEETGLDENTLIVLTTDHASVVDEDFINTFGDTYSRNHWFCDTIPLTFYYKGITPETIDAEGRNSICFADTLLDYLDKSAPNFFLGESLFGAPNYDNLFVTTFCIPEDMEIYTTIDCEVVEATQRNKRVFQERVTDYLSLV